MRMPLHTLLYSSINDWSFDAQMSKGAFAPGAHLPPVDVIDRIRLPQLDFGRTLMHPFMKSG